MMLDVQNLLSDQQNLAQAAGNYLSTNTIDLGATGTIPLGGSPVSDPGRARAVELFAQVTETFTSGGAGTLQFQLVTADSADLATNLTVVQETAAIALATLVAGYQARLAMPAGIAKRYLGLRYVIATAAMTAGKVTAGIALDKQTNPVV